MLVLTSLLGDAGQSPFLSWHVCFHAQKPILVTEAMGCQIHWFALEVHWDPLVEGSADTVSSSLWVQKGRGEV